MTEFPDLTTIAPAGYRRRMLQVSPEQVPAHAQQLLHGGYRLALIAGHDDANPHPDTGARTAPDRAAVDRAAPLRVVYLFAAPDPDRRVELQVLLPREDPRIPSIAGLSFAAGRFERELRDLFGIVPADHPLPRRLVRHFRWPRGWYPMLADAGPAPTFGDQDGPYPFRAVEGPGVYEIPVGPVHAGMIEPGHFRFSVVGETILNLKARLWFVHRGVEKLFQARPIPAGVELAERISGDTAAAHTLAYCRAVEDACGMACDPDTDRLRQLVVELERLYNHITDIGALCNDVGHSVLNAAAGRIRERLLRLNDHTTGHRLLRGAIHPGGAALASLPSPAGLTAIGQDAAELAHLALSHSVVRDRFTGTAVLTREQATDLGALGYVARASGLSVDARYDHPAPGGATPANRPVHHATGGDVLARFCVRADEITAAVAHLHTLLGELDGRRRAGTYSHARQGSRAGSGVGIVEGWRGTIVHRVETTPEGTLSRVKIVDPSFFNWPALPVALAATIVPDFPLVNKSFNLSYAGNDL